MFSAAIKAWTLLLGSALGFASAVWLGREAEQYSKPAHFVRFHYQLAPETLYYPPFSMLENLALARAQPGKTLVLIAGNSILNGFGQVESDVWHLRLQEELGDRFAVINLSFRGTLPCEGATLVAESLLQRGVPLVLISNTAPGVVGRSAGGAYGYLYWQELCHRRLLPFPERAKDIADWEVTLPPAAKEVQNEMRRSAELDATFHLQSLWHHVGYRHFFTAWSPLNLWRSWRPRDQAPDAMPGPPPLEARFQESSDANLEITRSFSSALAEQDSTGHWHATSAALGVSEGLIEHMFPPALRSHTLMILNQNAPFFRERLTTSERERDETVFAAYEQQWRDHGIACFTAGTDFTNADFRDRTHLTATGGNKLAHLVALRVRELAAR